METHNKLRKACIASIKRINDTLPQTDSAIVLTGLVNHIKETLSNALAEPVRNCEVGTAEEQMERYLNFADRYNPCAYRGYARCAEDCPVNIKLTQEGRGELLCQLEWAQMPYKEGENNGNEENNGND